MPSALSPGAGVRTETLFAATITSVAHIRVEPAGIEFQAAVGETVLDAARKAGYYWPEGCAHNGECTNCAMQVLSGLGRLSGIGRYERQNIIRQRGHAAAEDPRLRLACQAHVEGDLVLLKRGVGSLDSLQGANCCPTSLQSPA